MKNFIGLTSTDALHRIKVNSEDIETFLPKDYTKWEK